jgi:ditrans,polycis-polyprenyl diphosphate synthase
MTWWTSLQAKATNFLLRILAAGPIPKHVAFVMDGNRRYARKNQLAVQQGHSEGYTTLRHVSEIGEEYYYKVLSLQSWIRC